MDSESWTALALGVVFGIGPVLAWTGVWREWHSGSTTPGDPSLGRHAPITLVPAVSLACFAAGLFEVVSSLAVVLMLVAMAFGVLALWDAVTKRIPGFLEPAWARREHR